MVKNAIVKDFFREIKKTFSRFVSITLLLMLAVGFFAGLRATEPDMKTSADRYMDETNMFDIHVLSTMGLTQADVQAIADMDGVEYAEGSWSMDAVVDFAQDSTIVKMMSLSDKMNTPQVVEGKLPEDNSQCAVEQALLTALNVSVGDTIEITQLAEGMEDAVVQKRLTITGVVRSPLYMSKIGRGSTSLGSGSLSAFIVVPDSEFDLDYYTDIYLNVAGAKEIMAYNDEYFDLIDPVTEAIEAITDERAQIRYDEVVGDAQTELDDARAELEDAKQQLADGEAELEDAKKQYDDGVKELEDAKQQLADGQAEYDSNYSAAYSKLSSAKAELESTQKQVDEARQQLEQAQEQLDTQRADGQAQLDSARQQLDSSAGELNAAYEQFNAALNEYEVQKQQWDALTDEQKQAMPELGEQLEQARVQLEQTQKQLDENQTQLDAGYIALQSQQEQLDETCSQAQSQIDSQKQSLDYAAEQLNEGWAEYNSGLAQANSEFAQARAELDDARQAIEDAQAELDDAKQEISDAEAELEENRQKAADAEEEIDDAQQEIDDVQMGKWYVLDRSSNSGYVSYGQDSDRMGAIGNVFPVIFFAVAALVCLTSMTRMVEEKRVEIGTYKALGVSESNAALKYIGYSLFASIIGVACGLTLGMTLLPRLIFSAYNIMYDVPKLYTPMLTHIVIISAAAGIACTVGATLVSALATMRETPASLLRPKAPAAGKRVFLERIKPLWKRMSFFSKVSARNILRYKKRFWMTLVGIAGCTALIVTGFGLRDSIHNITRLQFDEIQQYDLQMYFIDNITPEQKVEIAEALDEDTNVAEYTMINETSVDFESGGGIASGYYYVPENPEQLKDFIRLRHREDGKEVQLTDNGALITEKLSELLELEPGDTFTIVEENIRYEVYVEDIVENYVYHYVFMTPEYYEQVLGHEAEMNQALITTADGSEEMANEVSSRLLKVKGVNYTAFFDSIAERFEKSMSSVNSVVAIIIVAAALLAFIVLYNLTSINITERTKELATLKVLGFRDIEVSEYIVRENTALTILGCAIGLIGGKFLHGWLVRTVEVEMCMFGRSASALSYVLAALMTVVFTVIVNIIGHSAMKKISMVESLKSNE